MHTYGASMADPICVTQGIAKGSDWALWVNENIFHFVLFCRPFEAIEV